VFGPIQVFIRPAPPHLFISNRLEQEGVLGRGDPGAGREEVGINEQKQNVAKEVCCGRELMSQFHDQARTSSAWAHKHKKTHRFLVEFKLTSSLSPSDP
jgi:hypothetical protein